MMTYHSVERKYLKAFFASMNNSHYTGYILHIIYRYIERWVNTTLICWLILSLISLERIQYFILLSALCQHILDIFMSKYVNKWKVFSICIVSFGKLGWVKNDTIVRECVVCHRYNHCHIAMTLSVMTLDVPLKLYSVVKPNIPVLTFRFHSSVCSLPCITNHPKCRHVLSNMHYLHVGYICGWHINDFWNGITTFGICKKRRH